MLPLLAFCVLLFSCASNEAVPERPVFVDISGDWLLSSIIYNASLYDGYNSAQRFLEEASGSLGIVFSAERSGKEDFAFYGFAGVNYYSGFLSFAGEKLIENPPAVTLSAGPARAERFERLFLQELTNVLSAALLDGGGTLALYGSGGSEMVFERFALQGTSWRLSAFNDGRAMRYFQSHEDAPFIAFGEDGNFSGSTSVNRMHGRYESDAVERALSFSPIATTRMVAPNEERAQLESAYLRALEGTASYRLSASSLTLCSEAGENLLVFYYDAP